MSVIGSGGVEQTVADIEHDTEPPAKSAAGAAELADATAWPAGYSWHRPSSSW